MSGNDDGYELTVKTNDQAPRQVSIARIYTSTPAVGELTGAAQAADQSWNGTCASHDDPEEIHVVEVQCRQRSGVH